MRPCTWPVAVALVLCAGQRAGAQQPSARLSLDSLLNTQIQTASKYLQTSAEAPASVTILTADDIALHRYRNLAEALESVRSFYLSNDRNYPYLGTRGFSRPTDYNNRILVLVDGHALNDQTWGGAPVGSDLPINMDAIERIEVVRGPGSVLYGTNAMFAVINVVTKTGAQLDGVRASAGIGTGFAREAAVAAGRAIGVRGSIAGSAIATRTDGGILRFPELSDDNGGIARNLDWEESVGALAAASLGNLSARMGYRSRSKGIPTGAYDSALDDPRAMTKDETVWGEVSARRESGGVLGVGVRLYGDWYQYTGVYPSAPGTPYTDGGGSTAFGAEVVGTWDPVSRDRITFGAEYRRVPRANYFEHESTGVETSDDAPFTLGSLFAENALHVSSRVDVVTGVRYERRSRANSALAPRFAVLLTPSQRTTIKLLYGQAYRTPSASEAEFSTATYARNPDLRAERVATSEVEVQHHLSKLLVSGTAFRYQLRNLIDLVSIDGLRQQFLNRARAHATGIALQADLIPGGPVSARAIYTAQRTRDDESRQPLTNSPAHIASLSVIVGSRSGLHAAATVRYESGRLTVQETSTDEFVRADVNVGYALASTGLPSGPRAVGVSARVTNLFNTSYSLPGGFEHRQASLPQPRSVATLRLDWSR